MKVILNLCYMNLEPDSSTGFKACWLANKEKKLTDFVINFVMTDKTFHMVQI